MRRCPPFSRNTGESRIPLQLRPVTAKRSKQSFNLQASGRELDDLFGQHLDFVGVVDHDSVRDFSCSMKRARLLRSAIFVEIPNLISTGMRSPSGEVGARSTSAGAGQPETFPDIPHDKNEFYLSVTPRSAGRRPTCAWRLWSLSTPWRNRAPLRIRRRGGKTFRGRFRAAPCAPGICQCGRRFRSAAA